MDIFQNSQKIINTLSKDLLLKPDRFYPLSVVYLWPTKYCPVGCAHCMFASPKPQQIDRRMILSKQAISNFIKISHQAKLESLIISGGGEPTLEFSNILRLIKEAHFNYFELITSAYWSSNTFRIEKILGQIQKALSEKKDRKEKFSFNLRVSIDQYHQKIIKIEWLTNLVNILRKDSMSPINKRKYPDINIYFRSLLIEDDTADQLSSNLRAWLSPMKDYIRYIIFSDRSTRQINKIPVFYKSVYFVGRGSDISVKKIIDFKQYLNSYSDENNDIRLGMTYLAPNSIGAILDGLNVTVTYEGKIMPYGGVSDVYGDIYKDNYQDFLNKLFGDIISRVLLLKGLNYVKKIAQEVRPDLDKIIKKKNWFASIADESLVTPETKLYVALRLIQKSIRRGEIKQEYLPSYLKKFIFSDKSYLQKKYYQYINKAKITYYTYPNEMLKIIKKSNNIASSPQSLHLE